MHSSELNRRLGANRSVSHSVNPGVMLGDFHRSDPAPARTSSQSMRSMIMGYLPPVWIMRKLYGLVFTNVANAMLRDSVTGAKAVFHVATAKALGFAKAGGGLFADTAGAFVNCGKAPDQCGRVKLYEQPAAAADQKLAKQLWTRTEKALGHHLRPLAGDGEEGDEPQEASEQYYKQVEESDDIEDFF
mmetsp:Transcript_61763/g.169730  ORF Transcript_61763/g.169730 Transcript_61763/m.169730 type:complete len:188 (+) Transcript_61763:521-1084(+)